MARPDESPEFQSILAQKNEAAKEYLDAMESVQVSLNSLRDSQIRLNQAERAFDSIENQRKVFLTRK